MTPGCIGDPRGRAAASVRDDIASDLVSSKKAATVYGFLR
jgi:hypothetical protein